MVCQYIDMKCVNCFHVKTTVSNSRRHKLSPATWRRRQCHKCHSIFTTYERPALDGVAVLATQGQATTPFNLGKLIISISRSFQHNKELADNSSYFLAQSVETQIILSGNTPSVDDIAAITHQVLHRFDPIAALQYGAQHGLVTLRRRPGRPATFYDP